MRIVAYLSMIAIVLLCGAFAANQIFWMAYALRGVLFALALIGLIILVIRGLR